MEYGRESLEALVQLVEDHAAQDAKIIFSGHRGCGKSTLLAQFGRAMSDRYFVTFFSISDLIEMSDVNHINILFAIAVNLMLEAEKQQIEIPKGTRDSFHKWFAKRTRTEIETPVNAEVAIGFDLFKIISGKLKTESSIRDEIKQEFKRNVSELVAKLNEIAATIQAASHKDVLVIIDDLDKLDLAVVREIFLEHGQTFLLPSFNIIFEVPISALYDIYLSSIFTNIFDESIVVIPAIKVIDRGSDFSPDPVVEKNVRSLCEILYRRIPADLFDASIAEQIVLKSGGILRELVRISNRCCRVCLTEIRRKPDLINLRISQEILNKVIQGMRLDFEMTLGLEDYEVLLDIHKNPSSKRSDSQTFLKLLNGLHILEYRNSEIWYCIHPIVKEILEIKGLI